jgi:hypothetical protein
VVFPLRLNCLSFCIIFPTPLLVLQLPGTKRLHADWIDQFEFRTSSRKERLAEYLAIEDLCGFFPGTHFPYRSDEFPSLPLYLIASLTPADIAAIDAAGAKGPPSSFGASRLIRWAHNSATQGNRRDRRYVLGVLLLIAIMSIVVRVAGSLIWSWLN